MEVYKGDEVWEIDEGLRNTAVNLLNTFPDELGHIDLDKVVFVRANGVKLSKTNTNWYGKCYLVKVPLKIISHYVLLKLGHSGMLDLSNMQPFDDLLDISYIVAINTDAIENEGGPIDKIEEVTLHHELLHISQDMEKLVKHDVQDFSTILHRYGPYWMQGVFEESTAKQEPAFLDDFVNKLTTKGSKIIRDCEESE